MNTQGSYERHIADNLADGHALLIVPAWLRLLFRVGRRHEAVDEQPDHEKPGHQEEVAYYQHTDLREDATGNTEDVMPTVLLFEEHRHGTREAETCQCEESEHLQSLLAQGLDSGDARQQCHRPEPYRPQPLPTATGQQIDHSRNALRQRMQMPDGCAHEERNQQDGEGEKY